jgi:hypothetical protein
LEGIVFKPEKAREARACLSREGEAEKSGLRDIRDAVRPVGHGRPVDQDDADNLAEGERDDGEIVASKSQHREAENDAPQRRGSPRDRKAHPEAEAEMGGEQREHIGAHRVEGDVTKVEQTCEADHDVQPPAEHHVGEHEDREVEQVAERKAEMERLLQEIGDEREQDREGDAADGEDARVGKIREEVDDGAAHSANAEKSEQTSRHESKTCRIDDAGHDQDQRGD